MVERVELEARVPPEQDGERLDQAAARLFPDYSRSRLQTWIKSGQLRVNGETRRTRDKVVAGALLEVCAELEEAVGLSLIHI